MTVDIRAAAQREAGRRWDGAWTHMAMRQSFIDGAVWAQARVTPTREQIAELIEQNSVTPRTDAEHCADAVLALIHARANTP